MSSYWIAMLAAFGQTLAIEVLVLLLGLSRRHPWPRRVLAGIWLTSVTFPLVWLVLPLLVGGYGRYLVVAETATPLIECALFYLAFLRGEAYGAKAAIGDLSVVALANVLSFVVVEQLG